MTGEKYVIAEGFDVGSSAVWAEKYVSSDAAGVSLSYRQIWQNGTLSLTVKNDPEPAKPAAPDVAVAIFNVTNGFATMVQDHAASFINSQFSGNSDVFRTVVKNFMPTAPDTKTSVWAEPWYRHVVVDRLRVGGTTQDSKLKTYGVTFGIDKKLESGAVAGFAVNVSKSESKGQNAWEGSRSDGKLIGLSVYGAKNFGSVTLVGDAGISWFSDDLESPLPGLASSRMRADNENSRAVTTGATAYWNLRTGGAVEIRPFFGARYSRFSQDDFVLRVSAGSSEIKSDNASQWSFPLGVRFD